MQEDGGGHEAMSRRDGGHGAGLCVCSGFLYRVCLCVYLEMDN